MAGIYGNSMEDRYFERMLDKHLDALDAQDAAHDERVEELREEYLDDTAQIFDVLINEDYVDADAIQETLRAGLLAYKYNRDSFDTFAKSFFQMLSDGVDKKAEVMA